MLLHSRRFLRAALCIALILSLSVGSAWAASYATLEFGSRGTEVLQLQKALLALGFDPSGTDGKFGRGTERAVIAYQSSKGLTPDGKAGSLTLTQLYSEYQSQGTASSTGTTGATATSSSTLKYGDSGTRVTELQTALQALGYSPNGIDGRFGAGTQKAVINFQRNNGLTADGLAGTRTLNLLYSLSASGGTTTTTPTASTGSSSTAAIGSASLTRTLRKGATGQDVVLVQTKLQALGYYAGSIDGSYGSGSMAAVTAFQQSNGLTADGLAGAATFNALFGSNPVAAGNASTSTPVGSTPSVNVSGGSAYSSLNLNASGAEVTRLQNALLALGYTVNVTGTYDSTTKSAVVSFQKSNGLSADGVAGALTQGALYGGSAKGPGQGDGTTTSSGLYTPSVTIDASTGVSSGPDVSQVQLLHWYNVVKPSCKSGQLITIFDPATNLTWTLRLYSLGHHADSEPYTATDTAIMYKAFGNTNTWTPKPVYVQLPDGRWTLASMHNVPHLTGSIKTNDFDGHLCVHFLRDMSECEKNDPNYGVQHQNCIRTKWKQMTGQDVAYQ